MSSLKHRSSNPTFRLAAGAGVGVFGGASPAARAAAEREAGDVAPAGLSVPKTLRVSAFSYSDTSLTLEIMTGETASLDFCRHGLRFRLTRRGDGKVHSWTERRIHANGATEDRALSREEMQYALALAAQEMDPVRSPVHRELLTDFQRKLPNDAFPDCKARLDRSNPDLQKPDQFMFNRGHYKYIIGIADPHSYTATFQLHTGMARTRPMTPEERGFACQVISRELPINDNLLHRDLLDRLKELNGVSAFAAAKPAP